MLSELQRESAGLEKTVDSLSVIDSVNETQESYREIHFTKIISAYIKPTSEAIGGFLISFRLYKAESSLAVYNIMSGLFLKAPELVLRNLLYLSEKCKQICRYFRKTGFRGWCWYGRCRCCKSRSTDRSDLRIRRRYRSGTEKLHPQCWSSVGTGTCRDTSDTDHERTS